VSEGRKSGWFSRRGGIGKLLGFVAEGAQEIGDSASTLKPKRFDRRGFFGRDRDGGIARFRETADLMSANEIEAAHRRWAVERQAFLIASLACVVLAIGSAILGFLTLYFLIGLVVSTLFFGLRYFVADFRAWQIEQGRFAPPAEYLNYKLPRNMQIVEKD
jgi:hypothetical protein